MCGIAGQFSFGNKADGDSIKKMTSALVHRGPDDKGFFIKDNVALGFRRLSIIDLETGNQPIFNENNELCIIFNGEIYNYSELKDKLTLHQFKTKTDTEVILHLFETYGVDAFGMLNGMFALAIYDFQENILYCARDRFGQKPFEYYYIPGKDFIFASEMKALRNHREVDMELNASALAFYFFYNYIPAPHAVYKNVYKLPPQSYIVVDSSGIKVRKYSVHDTESGIEKLKFHEILDNTSYLLEKAVKRHLIADVEVGIFLSGGLDSTTVLKYASKLKPDIRTFSATFGSYISEYEYISRASEKYGVKPNIIDINPDFRAIERIISCYSEPFGDSACVPTYMISDFASKSLKVVLTGEGGDELFGGYARYADLMKQYLKFLSFLKNLAKGRPAKEISLKSKYQDMMAFSSIEELRLNYDLDLSGLLEHFDELVLNSIEDIIFHEQHQRLPDNLFKKVDIASMANGLEARCPFLDHELVNFVNALSLADKVTSKKSKIIIKEILSGDMSDDFLERPKMGFGAPVRYWMGEDVFKTKLLEIINQESSNLLKLVKPLYIESLKKHLLLGKPDYNHWKIFVLLVWLRENGIQL